LVLGLLFHGFLLVLFFRKPRPTLAGQGRVKSEKNAVGFGIICGITRGFRMPAVLEAIDKMTTSEKFDTMNYLWSSLSVVQSDMVPAWHRKELEKTEARVASGIERPIAWGAAKEIIKNAFPS
jgi:hypothetical protein